MLNIKEDRWRRYGGWIFVAPLVLQLIWDGINGQSLYDFKAYVFGGFRAVVALLCAGKIGSR